MINLFDTVRLKRDLLNYRDFHGEIINLPAGSIGTVLMIYDERVGEPVGQPPGYEVDFCDPTGDTVAIITLEADDIEPDSPYKPMKKLDDFWRCAALYNCLYVLVAQLDRASVSEAEGLGFESQRAQRFPVFTKIIKSVKKEKMTSEATW